MSDPFKVFKVNMMLLFHSFIWLKIIFDKFETRCVGGYFNDQFLFEVGILFVGTNKKNNWPQIPY